MDSKPSPLLNALWECGVASGMDTDGDTGPEATVAGMGVAGFAAAMLASVKDLKSAYDDCLSESPDSPLDEEHCCGNTEHMSPEYLAALGLAHLRSPATEPEPTGNGQ